MKIVDKMTLRLLGKSTLFRKQVSAVGRKTEMCALNGDGGGMEKQNTTADTSIVSNNRHVKSWVWEKNQDYWLHWVFNLLIVDLTFFLVPSPGVG